MYINLKTSIVRSVIILVVVLICSMVSIDVLFASGKHEQSFPSQQDTNVDLTLTPINTPNSTPVAPAFHQEQSPNTSNVENATWEQKSPTLTPTPSHRAQMGFVYDSFRYKTLAVGGSYWNTRFPDTWAYDGENWQKEPQLFPGGGRNRPAIAYDPVRRVTVLFGGSLPGDSTFFNDTWEYDGATWERKFPYNPPTSRNGATMVFDTKRGKMVMFGGYRWEGRMVFFDETWEYDGGQWTQLFPSQKPAARETAAMVFDTTQERVILFGGGQQAGYSVYNDTWSWDGSQWSHLFPSSSPPARWAHAMAYDQVQQKVVLFGGLTGTTNSFNDTWAYDGSTWLPVTSSNPPPKRWDHGMAYDAAHNKIVMFGGMDYQYGFLWRNDTWEFSAPLPLPTRPVVFLPGFAGSRLYDARDSSNDCSKDPTNLSPAEVFFNEADLLPIPGPFEIQRWNNKLPRLNLNADGVTAAIACTDVSHSGVLWSVSLGLINKDFYSQLRVNLQNAGYSGIACDYDWRRYLDGETDGAAPAIIDKCIADAQNGDLNQQVDIIAHSTGGLAIRSYILSKPERAAKIHTIITMGTPYLGALKSFTLLRYGVTLISELDLIADDTRIKQMALNAPAVYALLPSDKFFERGHGYFQELVETNSQWSQIYYDKPATMDEFLARNYNANLTNYIHTFHSEKMDDWSKDSLDESIKHIKFYVFAGYGTDTLRWIRDHTTQKWWQSEPTTEREEFSTRLGDGTALLDSATLYLGKYTGTAKICLYYGIEHGDLPLDSSVFADLNKALHGIEPCPIPSQVSSASVFEDFNLESRQLTVEGPGLVHIWDNQGRHTGPFSDTLLIENNIPLVTYSAGENATFVSLPPISTYTVTLQMSDTTPVTLKLYTIAAAETLTESLKQTVLFQDIPGSSGGTATIRYDPLADPSTYSVTVDVENDSVPDQTFSPSVILDDLQSDDSEPPTSSISVAGQRDSFGYFTGQVTVTLTASDTLAGIQKIEYSLDGGHTGKVYTEPFTISAKDVPILFAQAVDRAGNTEYPRQQVRLRPENLPPTGMIISGPTAIPVRSQETFSVIVVPTNTLQPVIFAWFVTDHPLVTTTRSLTDSANLEWSTPGLKTIVVTVTNAAGVITGSLNVDVVPDVEAAVSLASATQKLFADGKSSTVISATVKDRWGNLIPAKQVSFTSTLGQITPTGQTNESGVAAVTLTSVPKVGVATITASVGNLTNSIQVDMIGSTVSGIVFLDANDNGSRDTGESGVAGVTILLKNTNDNTLYDTKTNIAGAFSLANLPGGTYTVELLTPSGYTITTQPVSAFLIDSQIENIPDIGMLVKVYLPLVNR